MMRSSGPAVASSKSLKLVRTLLGQTRTFFFQPVPERLDQLSMTVVVIPRPRIPAFVLVRKKLNAVPARNNPRQARLHNGCADAAQHVPAADPDPARMPPAGQD